MTPLYSLGRRYERLLYFGAVVTAACLFDALLSSAIVERDRFEMKDALVDIRQSIEQNRDGLQAAFDERARLAKNKNAERPSIPPNSEFRAYPYDTQLHVLIMDAAFHVSADRRDAATRLLNDTVRDNLSVNENLLRITAKENDAVDPVRLLGVEIPRNVKLSVAGQELSIPVELLSRALTVILGPLLMIWLGSLYATRIREIQLLRTSNAMTESFPHVLNAYPMRFDVPWQQLRKFGVSSPRYTRNVLTGVRIVVVLALVGPALWAYGNALFDVLPAPATWSSYWKFMGVSTVALILCVQALWLAVVELVGGWFQIGFDVSVQGLIADKTAATAERVNKALNQTKP